MLGGIFMKEVRFGIVGMGVQGSLYANILTGVSLPYMPQIKKPKECVLTAVSSRSEKAKEFASHLPDVTYFSDWKEMIDSDLCDAIIITVPHFIHHEVAIYALRAGKHVLCEKPLDIRVSDIRDVARVKNEAGDLAFGVIFNQRTNAIFRQIKDIISSKVLGEIRRSNWIINSCWRPDSYYKSNDWRGTWHGEGGGITVNQVPHQLDLWLSLCGEPTHVYSVNRYGCHRNISVENDITVTAEYPNGATGVFIASTHDPLGTDRLEIDFNKGKIVVENSSHATIYRFKETEEEWNKTLSFHELLVKRQTPDALYTTEELTLSPSYGTDYVQIFENFAAHILRNEPLIATLADGLKEVELANSIQLSGWKKEAVDHPCSEDEFNEWLDKVSESEKDR